MTARRGMVILATVLLWAAGGKGDETPPGIELIRDPHFQQGFRVYDPQPGTKVVVGSLRWGQAAEPVWGLAQWSSRYPLTDAEPQREADGAVRFANLGKAVSVAPPGAEAADLILEVNGRAEYSDRARRAGEPWVHLLVEQRLDCPVSLAELRALPFHFEAKLLECRRFETDDYSPRRHAAQYQLFVTVQNLNRESPGYGDFYWFGVSIYDDRRPVNPSTVHGDQASGKLIYTPAGDTYTAGSVHDRGWVTFDGDLLPEIRKGLEAAWQRGFLKGSRDLGDYRLGGLNLGWEVPGIFEVAMQARDLSLRAVPKGG